MLYIQKEELKNMNGKFLRDMLVNWCTVVLEHYYSCDGLLITVEPVMKGTCIER